ncbi:MAG: Hint domain-containing protein [Albidovulum sp.]
MPTGYLVSLGEGAVAPGDAISGDAISGDQTTFTTASHLGNGGWKWSGTWRGDGKYHADTTDTYQLGTDGNVYFVPAIGGSGPTAISDPVEGPAADAAPAEAGADQTDSEADLRAVCLPSFVQGTLIATSRGEVPVETLGIGDLVLTMDNGYQPILGIGTRSVPAHGHLAPVRLHAGAFSNPRDLLVSPQQLVLLRSPEAELLFGAHEVLATARHLINGDTITRAQAAGDAVYIHLLFAKHEIVFSEGIPTGSFHPGDPAWDALTPSARQDIMGLFPALGDGTLENYSSTARLCLKPREVRLITRGLSAPHPLDYPPQAVQAALPLSA